MSRLIDADLLKTSMEQGKIVIDEDVLKCDTIHEMLLYLLEKVEDCMAEIIDSQPTAYDVEAVVRELEKALKHYEGQEKRQMELDCGMVACHTNGVQQGIKFAIEIVRGGRNE